MNSTGDSKAERTGLQLLSSCAMRLPKSDAFAGPVLVDEFNPAGFKRSRIFRIVSPRTLNWPSVDSSRAIVRSEIPGLRSKNWMIATKAKPGFATVDFSTI
jgi:hypothetical protein